MLSNFVFSDHAEERIIIHVIEGSGDTLSYTIGPQVRAMDYWKLQICSDRVSVAENWRIAPRYTQREREGGR